MGSDTYALSVAPTAATTEAVDRRTADLAAFAKGVVHDLRNPLNVIVANTYLLRQRLEAGAEPRILRPIERVAEQVSLMEQMLNGYLAFDLALHPALQRLRVNEVIEGLASSMVIPQGSSLAPQLAEGLPMISADPRLLDTALRALVRNSLRATGAEGQVRIASRPSAGGVQVVVEDDGLGVEPSVLPHVFEPFFSTWEEHAGLGLSIADRVARALGGHVCLNTTPGEGTQVVLEFPAA